MPEIKSNQGVVTQVNVFTTTAEVRGNASPLRACGGANQA